MRPEFTVGGSITVKLVSSLTGLDSTKQEDFCYLNVVKRLIVPHTLSVIWFE